MVDMKQADCDSLREVVGRHDVGVRRLKGEQQLFLNDDVSWPRVLLHDACNQDPVITHRRHSGQRPPARHTRQLRRVSDRQ